jgi:hypothetical protein
MEDISVKVATEADENEEYTRVAVTKLRLHQIGCPPWKDENLSDECPGLNAIYIGCSASKSVLSFSGWGHSWPRAVLVGA